MKRLWCARWAAMLPAPRRATETATCRNRWVCKPISPGDRKSTRLNSSHVEISYAVFCLKKKNNHYFQQGEQKNHRDDDTQLNFRLQSLLFHSNDQADRNRKPPTSRHMPLSSPISFLNTN